MLFEDLLYAGYDFRTEVEDLLSPMASGHNVTPNDKDIEVICQGHDWDAIAAIINKTNRELTIDFYDIEETIVIAPQDYNLLLANDEGYFMLLQFKHCNYKIYFEGGED